MRLAQTLHIPVADGVLAATGEGPAYASLEVASPDIPLPDLLQSQTVQVAEAYPDEVAALIAFDIFIGNRDRMRNIKASTVTPHIQIFKGFDHSHSLLSIEEDPPPKHLQAEEFRLNRQVPPLLRSCLGQPAWRLGRQDHRGG